MFVQVGELGPVAVLEGLDGNDTQGLARGGLERQVAFFAGIETGRGGGWFERRGGQGEWSLDRGHYSLRVSGRDQGWGKEAGRCLFAERGIRDETEGRLTIVRFQIKDEVDKVM